MIGDLSADVERGKDRIRATYAVGCTTPLAPIPENSSSKIGAGEEDVFEAMKKKQAAGGAKNGAVKYEFNKAAHRKYNSQKSLFDRILKSHSEGNRFIRNEDL